VATTAAGDEVSVGRLPFALFVGLAISGSAFAILARILDERRLLGTRMGMVLMGSAAVDDLAVWSLAAIVLAVAGSDAGAPADVATTFALLVVLAAVLFRVVRPALQRYLLPRFSDAGVLQPNALAVLLVLLLAAAGASAAIGVSPILGAFLFGAAIPRRAPTDWPHR
jgi:Kef-type K+ transport system membrane component KefB